MQTYHAIILQSPPPVAPPAGLTEWGVLGAIVFFVVKEGVVFLKQKDSKEADLTNSLIADIRNTNKELREFLERDAKSSDRVMDALLRTEQKLSRNQTEIMIDNRENLARLTAMVAALHNRFDQMGISPTHQKRIPDRPGFQQPE